MSVLWLYSCPLGTADSKDRLRCVRGFSQYNEVLEKVPLNALIPVQTLSSPNATELNISILDPALTIVNCDECLFLACFQISAIFHDNCSVQSLPAQYLHKPNVHLEGQIMKLALIMQSGGVDALDWEWNGAYEPRASFRDLEGHAVELINPDVVPASCGRNKGESMYVFHTAELHAMSALLYERMAMQTHSLPNIAVMNSFPYRTEDGTLHYYT